MPGKPHKTSFPEETFTVKDPFCLNSKREGLNPVPGYYRQFYRQPVPLEGDSTDSCRNVLLYKSTRFNRFSIADDSPRRT